MGPELIIVALGLYAIAFAIVGAAIGALIKSRGLLIAAIGAVSAAVGVGNALFAPSPHKLEAGLIAFLFAALVIGSSGALVISLRRSHRARTENTAV